jgi:uncharacterized protein (UPF0276 family)
MHQPTGLPLRAGLGLKHVHVDALLASRAPVGFFEVHAENYMVDGGPLHHALARIRADYPISLHGVGLSIGGEGPLDGAHLDRLAALIDRYQPAVFSEHLAWSSHGNAYLADLLPLPWTATTLDRVCQHIDQVQSRLKRPMLLENPATCLEFAESTLAEADFLARVQQRTGCGLLLDLNNLHVSCINHHRDAMAYLDALPLQAVGQVHLAGFAEDQDAAGDRLLIDSHGSPVDRVVWQLFDDLLARLGPVPTLIERDNKLPPLPVLLAEVAQAEARLLAAWPTRAVAGVR